MSFSIVKLIVYGISLMPLRVFNGAFRIWHFVMSGSSGYGEGCGIIAPFIYIAMHVVKPPRVGFVLTHSLNLIDKVLSYLEAMAVISLGSVRMVTPRINSGGAGPAGVLPLGLSR